MIGPLTYLDVALIAVAFISGLLAMYRGFAREVLSILSWIAAAGSRLLDFFDQEGHDGRNSRRRPACHRRSRRSAVALVVALIVLIIVHLITARISDAILDSQVGMVDRVFGFIFGVLRGFLLFVIPYMAYEAFISPDKDKQTPARSRCLLSRLCESDRRSHPLGSLAGHSAAFSDHSADRRPNRPARQQGFLDQKGRSVALVIKGKRYYMTVA